MQRQQNVTNYTKTITKFNRHQKKGEQCLTACHGVDAMQEQMEYNSYLLDLPELKALRHNDYSKEELMKMLKDKMTKEELLGLLLG